MIKHTYEYIFVHVESSTCLLSILFLLPLLHRDLFAFLFIFLGYTSVFFAVTLSTHLGRDNPLRVPRHCCTFVSMLVLRPSTDAGSPFRK